MDKPPGNGKIPGYLTTEWMFLAPLAKSLGFCGVGIAPAGPVHPESLTRWNRWLVSGYEAGLAYMLKNQTPRADTSHPGIVADADAVVVVALPYARGAMRGGCWRYVARHARGRDYHKTMRRGLKALASAIAQVYPDSRSRVFVDSAPVMERSWALMAGVGTLLKNGAVCVEGVGPRVLLGEIVLSGAPRPVRGDIGVPFRDCGDCSRCLEACPSGAIVAPAVVDSNRCLSYWSIERGKHIIPRAISHQMQMIFGCDICTAVCPLNRDGVPSGLEPTLSYSKAPPDLEALLFMGDEALAQVLEGTALLRSGVSNIRDNAEFVLENIRNQTNHRR